MQIVNDQFAFITTYGNGLVKVDFEKNTKQFITLVDGIPSLYLYDIYHDNRNNLWISSNFGIIRYNPFKKQFRSFGPAEGVQDFEFNSFSSSQSKTTGELFFGGMSGLNYFSPDSIKDNAKPPVVIIQKFSKKDIKRIMDKISSEKGEIEELVDYDGSFSNSKVPIHDPTLSPTKTMDQTVFAARQATNPLLRGYRVYYGESVVREIDARGAFGFEETELEGEDAKEAIETFKELGVEDPKGRAKEMGYDPKLEKKKLPGSFTRKRLEEVQKEKVE
mgnify:CR=1 FL=1